MSGEACFQKHRVGGVGVKKSGRGDRANFEMKIKYFSNNYKE